MNWFVDADPMAGREFSPDDLLAIDRIVDHYKNTPGALIPVLEQVQETIGYLPQCIQKRIAQDMHIPLMEVHGVVSFYSFFTMVPHRRQGARGNPDTACSARGDGRRHLTACNKGRFGPRHAA